MEDFTVIVETIAGNGTSGYKDAIGLSSQFNFPTGLAMDHDGNIIVCDSKNSKIRKIDIRKNYEVTTIAGSDPGYKEGPGKTAQFNDPDSIAADKHGNIYVCDGENKRIRKIDKNYFVSTIAGNGEDDYVDGKTSSFKEPCWVAADDVGNVFVSDTNRIRQISNDGSVKTIAGTIAEGYNDGPRSTSQFFRPTGIVVDKNNIFICDSFNNRIRKIDDKENVTTIAGNGTHGFKDGHSTSSIFCGPYGITTGPNGNIIVADTLNHRIRLIDMNGVVTTIAGDGTDGYNDGQAKAAKFNSPMGIATDAHGNIFVADVYNHRIRKVIIVPRHVQQTKVPTLSELVTKLVQDKIINPQESNKFLNNVGNITLQDLQNITDNLLEKLFLSSNMNELSILSKIHIFSAIKESRKVAK